MVDIGETKRTTNQRIREHKADTRNGHMDGSAIAEHALMTGHEVHWDAMLRTKGNMTSAARYDQNCGNETKSGGAHHMHLQSAYASRLKN